MIQAKPRFLSFEEYLNYDADSEQLYELFNGELIEVPPESGLNVQIANRLFLILAMLLGTDQIRGHGLELEVRGEPKNRYPDLTVLRSEHIEQLKQRNTIRLAMAPPVLVVEVVSPGEIQRDRDYIAKRQQYQDREIPEYWIVDPQLKTILILELQNGIYSKVETFSGTDSIHSSQVLDLQLSPDQVFTTSPS